MVSEKLERNIVLTGFMLMFIGLSGWFLSMILLWILEISGTEEFFFISQSLMSDVSFFFAMVVSLGALFFIIEFIFHKLGWASDPIELLKKQ